MFFQKGEIWNINLNLGSQFTVGHEQGNIRPCLVIKVLPQVQLATIIPLPSQVAVSRFPYTHYIQLSPQNGLTAPSIAMIFHIRTVSFKRFIKRIGNLENNDWDSIYNLIEDFFLHNFLFPFYGNHFFSNFSMTSL